MAAKPRYPKAETNVFCSENLIIRFIVLGGQKIWEIFSLSYEKLWIENESKWKLRMKLLHNSESPFPSVPSVYLYPLYSDSCWRLNWQIKAHLFGPQSLQINYGFSLKHLCHCSVLNSSPKKIGPSINPWYLWMWFYLEIGVLQM